MIKKKITLFVIVVLISFFFISSTSVSAFSLDDIVKGVKNLFDGDKKEFTIEPSITLAPDGDIDKNGEIDAGDIVRFSYQLTNTTDKEYSFATLKTNIDRQRLNFIHNIIGTASLEDNGKTITIPNFRIGANQIATVTFDAKINYYSSEDPTITTEADFIDNNNQSAAKSLKKEIKAKRINEDKIPGMIKQQI